MESDIIIIGGLGLIMGIVTSISGGAGVFAVPAMLAMGMPPINALALNRMSDFGVVLGALHNYNRSKSIDWKLAFIAMVPLGIGSFIGAKTVLTLSTETLKVLILIGVCVGIYFLLRPITPKEKPEKGSLSFLGLLMLLIVGVWSGALGMAGATFAVLVIVYFFHKNFLQARSTDVIAAIPETAIATATLSLGSGVSVSSLSVMFVASFIGAWIGSHMAVKHGDGMIKKAMVGIAVLMVIKVLLDF